MIYVDTHAHLTDERLDGREEVFTRLEENDVGLVINVGYDIDSSRKSAFIAQNRRGIYFTAGLHPTDGEEANEDNIAKIEPLLLNPKCVAVGEIGLDYHYGGDRGKQRYSFIRQLSLAEAHRLPVSVHARDCTADMIGIISEWGDKLPAVILHCYSMGSEAAKIFLKHNCYFAFGGAITFKNNKAIYEAARVIPLDRILTETDCPYMAPVPHRGETNEPAFVPLVLKKLAEVYGITEEKAADEVYANTLRAFGRIKS